MTERHNVITAMDMYMRNPKPLNPYPANVEYRVSS